MLLVKWDRNLATTTFGALIRFRVTWAPAGVKPFTYENAVPNPLAGVVFFALVEGWRLVLWRARRYVVTTARVVALDARRRPIGGAIARDHVRSVELRGRDVVVTGDASVVVFQNVDDPDAARAAIETPVAAAPEDEAAPERESRSRVAELATLPTALAHTTRRQRLGVAAALLGSIAIAVLSFAVHEELKAARHDVFSNYFTRGAWILYDRTRTPFLGRPRLEVVVLSRKPLSASGSGFALTTGGHSLEGVGRVFLIDGSGALTETKAPVGPALWAAQERLEASRFKFTSDEELDLLLEELEKLSPDEPLRKFLDEKPPRRP